MDRVLKEIALSVPLLNDNNIYATSDILPPPTLTLRGGGFLGRTD